jgi:hypothetical protein
VATWAFRTQNWHDGHDGHDVQVLSSSESWLLTRRAVKDGLIPFTVAVM